MRETLVIFGASATFWLLLMFALSVGLDRESDRLDKVREYNCQHYGQAINKHYGEELCPPTPWG